MKNAKLVIIDSEESVPSTLKDSRKITIGRKNLKIDRCARLKSNLEGLDDLLKDEEKTGFVLVFSDFVPFKKHLDKLKSLHESKIEFNFLNFQYLNKGSIQAVIELLEINSADKSRKIKKALDKKRKDGIQLGNPSITAITDKAIRRRKLKAWQNATNLEVRQRIITLKEEGHTYNYMAEHLNELGMLPRRGKKFYAKTIQRLFNSDKELNETFQKQNLKLESLMSATMGEDEKMKKIQIEGLEKDRNFDEAISFSVKTKLKEAFEVIIRDVNGETLFDQKYEAATKKIVISLDEYILLPGIHYVSLQTKEKYYDIYHCRIHLRENLRVKT